MVGCMFNQDDKGTYKYLNTNYLHRKLETMRNQFLII